MNDLAFNAGEISRLIKGLDDPIVPVGTIRLSSWMTQSLPLGQGIFDVIQSGVDQNTAVIPGGRFYPDCFVYQCALSK